jgi:hypothetical protein
LQVQLIFRYALAGWRGWADARHAIVLLSRLRHHVPALRRLRRVDLAESHPVHLAEAVLQLEMRAQHVHFKAVPRAEVGLAVELADAGHELHRDAVPVVVRDAARVPLRSGGSSSGVQPVSLGVSINLRGWRRDQRGL